MSGKKKLNIDKLTFEEASTQLEKIVSDLESGKLELDKAMEAYEVGQSLKEHCLNKLNAAQMIVENVKADDS